MSVVRTTCLKCGEVQRINFGDVSFAEALAALNKVDVPRECPGGFHVELGGWSTIWQFGAALVAVYGAEAEKSVSVQGMLACAAAYRENKNAAHRPYPVIEAQEAKAA